ncbi:MAG: nitrogen regulation protein NR(I) [Porticoccus sp.]|nr:nitrogen regulation protein NR(I) [Porticoccus sp.]
MTKKTVWIVDDDRSIRWVMEKALSRADLDVTSFENGNDLLALLDKQLPDTIISDIRMPGIDGLQLLKKIHASNPLLPVIITTAHSDLDSAVAAYQGGAFEYLPKPFDIDELIAVTNRAISFANEQSAEHPVNTDELSSEIIGEAPAMQEVFRAIGRLSHSNITVLINGESGTGKELVAKALHDHSPRKNNRFIALNMAAIPHDLIESELFGHEKGAFTGASQRREGRFQQADGGTLFLDEIGDMPPEAQTRLLRVLSNSEFYLVGGHTPVKVDVRIIAATHQNLEQMVAENRFREDLFHRLNVIRIHLPKLADRREDIPRLMQYFFQRAANELDTEPKTLSPDAEEHLCMQPWAGNVRQLENACRWLTVMAPGREVHLVDLPPELKDSPIENTVVSGNWEQQLRSWAQGELATGKQDILTMAVPTFERALIETALSHTNGRKRDAAELLGWGRNTLTRKLKELGMGEEEEK